MDPEIIIHDLLFVDTYFFILNDIYNIIKYRLKEYFLQIYYAFEVYSGGVFFSIINILNRFGP